MNEPNNFYSTEQGYGTNGYETEPLGYSSEGYQSNGYNTQQSEAYGTPDYFADGYRENVFEGNLNLADTPWTETTANPNPHFDRGETTTNSYCGYDDLEL
ncbi:hypothetical protein NIES2119_17915 [[Phormidium ambiguum] IAM M-71]|uniref:Uncharacterized protein n=1 Tax=[Phormidium ambiguum] IAM M-71 TaxID=454136 RepID=A0A1U7IGQ5_9CYAN|nr:hypothetical protein [Phormidium ambiguum]OKH36190.1 hypothetical protein NIES2119_17915 [Phormidium ambiguum IAM M-71]